MRNGVVVILCACFLVAGAVFADQGISGRVIDAHTRQPIYRAAVCTGQGGAYTDSGGYYVIHVPPGRYRVRSWATGYQESVYPESVCVVEGRITPDINFELVPAGGQTGGISGRVIDAWTRAPIQGATVTARGPNGQGSAHTCAQGGYQIPELPAGRYQVCASASGYEPAVYPESVTVTGGQITPNINFELEPAGGQTGGISGRVIDARTRQPIVGATVCTGHGGARTDSAGYYLILGLEPGRYRVRASAQGYEPAVYPESVEVVAGRITPEICFALVPRQGGETGTIAGAVFNSETREPVFGALVVATGPSRGQANTCHQGGFRIPGLLPGLYVVEVTARGYEPFRQDSVLVSAGQITEMHIGLTPCGGDPGAIAGTVTDSATGEPIAGAVVFAWGEAGQGEARTDSSGNYRICRLPAGTYRARACARGYYPQHYPEAIRVEPGQTTDGIDFALQVVPPGAAGIAGFVYDGFGQTEIAGARVVITGFGGSAELVTDERGDYLADALPAGEYLIEFSADGYQDGILSDPVVVEDGVITAFTDLALYPLTGVAQKPVAPDLGWFIRVEPSLGNQTRISWQVRSAGPVTVQVVDKAGRVVRTLERGPGRGGWQSAHWNGRDDSGASVAGGVYFCRVVDRVGSEMAKFVLVAE